MSSADFDGAEEIRAAWLSGLAPDPLQTVSQWADKHRILSSRGASEAGAYRTVEDAEAQRAKLSLTGLEAKVSEREQSGRTVFRVRIGPLDKKDDADKVKERLEALGHEAALVRVQR